MSEARDSRTVKAIFFFASVLCLFSTGMAVFAAEQVDQSNLPEWAGGWTHINPDPNGQARMWQTFTPDCPNITAVEIDIFTINPGRGGDTITVEIAKGGEILASVERYVEDGFEGLLRFEFDEAVAVVPGELYELKVHGTDLTRFGWRYASNTYDQGSRYVSADEHRGTDWLFQTYATVEPRIIYVDDDAAGANDGSSWENAYVYLQDALRDVNESEKPVEIRVSQGTYKPDQGGGNAPGDRDATFQLINGVTLKGGYAGASDPLVSAELQDEAGNIRDIELYETILSGDLNGDDVEVLRLPDLVNDPNRAENSYHVVTSYQNDETSVLNGFTITGGRADYLLRQEGHGGGMLNLNSNPTVTNCTFIGNLGYVGGGIYNSNSNPTLKNCTFNLNMANLSRGSTNDRGGGMYNDQSSPTLIECIFAWNGAVYGGGMYNKKSNLIIDNCTFSHNGAEGGGGISNYKSDLILTNCKFVENWATWHGGGMYNYGNGDGVADIINCTFGGNIAFDSGGGISNRYSNPNLTNCTFSDNSANCGGGMANYYRSNPKLINCTFGLNISKVSGGGIYNFDGSKPILKNCTFCLNVSEDSGGGMYNIYNSNPILINCILWDNTPDQIDGCANVSYSDIEGGWSEGGTGIIDEDPLFADLNNGDYHLKSQAGRYDPNSGRWIIDDVTSPCIDAGDPNMPVGDEPFPSGIRINMGAYGGTDQASKSISNVQEVVNVNDSDNGSQVTLRQGQILAVTLESNPTTGYSWYPVEKQDSIFEPFGDPIYFPPEEVDGVVGAGGWEIFYFRSVSAGQETLQLVYRRSWETDVEPIKTFSIDVVVN